MRPLKNLEGGVYFMLQTLVDGMDHYKQTMGNLIFSNPLYRNNFIKFQLINRTTEVPLAHLISEGSLRKELDAARLLPFTTQQGFAFLENLGIFSKSYIDFLRNYRLPEYELYTDNDQFVLTFSGPWYIVTYWETVALGIITELLTKFIKQNELSKSGNIKLMEYAENELTRKIKIVKATPGLVVIEFGTRRRAYLEWHDHVVSRMKEELPPENFVGTSNVGLAIKYNLPPKGTYAHEMYMGVAGFMDDNIYASHNKVIQDWLDFYGESGGILLTDNYGTDFFFRDLTREQAIKARGLRQDSGDPFTFINKAIKFYEEKGIDYSKKLLFFSDGLDIEKIIDIYDYCREIKIPCAFGWGTNLTNDIGLKPLSLVVKVVESNHHPVVKLSDNPAKALGPKDVVEEYKKIFGYDESLRFEKCTY